MTSAVAQLFDAMAPTYDDLEPWYEHLYTVLHGILRDTIGQAPSSRALALDAGCGTGFQSALLAELGWQTYGVDVSAGLLAVARRRLPGTALALASIDGLPYPDATFDAIVCCGSTLSFVDDPTRAVAEFGRVLRPGGRLLLDCEHRPSLDLAWMLASALTGDALGFGVPARDAWRALATRRRLRLAYPGYGPLWLFTKRELSSMLRAAGLSPVRAWGLHGVTNLIPSTVLHGQHVPRSLATAYRALRRIDTALIDTTPARALANSLVVLAERT
ncbi:MAG TPA: methyltransferase domain-containing protein [Methylomirabilota bacterium]|jgi:SAM-dependent methyltransferase|nr:methyltransferase domain-containing protein [Methylomirabilota bacterium]